MDEAPTEVSRDVSLRSTRQLRREPLRSQRFHSSFTGSDTDGFFHVGNKNFAVADFSSLGLFQNCLDSALRAIVGDHDLEFNFGKEIHRVFGSAVDLAVSFLPAKSFYFAQSHSFDPCSHQGFSHRLGFEWLNNSLDFFHRAILNSAAFEMASACAKCCGRNTDANNASRVRSRRYTLRPNFFSSSANEIWIIVGRPCGQQ